MVAVADESAIRDDGQTGVKAVIDFLEKLRKTVETSSNLSVDVGQLLSDLLDALSGAKDGRVWHELELDPKVREAWVGFDDLFCDTLIKADTYHDEHKVETKELEQVRLGIQAQAKTLQPYIDRLRPLFLKAVS